MQIKRDYSQPFFRKRKSRRRRYRLLAALLAALLGLAAVSQRADLERTARTLVGAGPTATPLPSVLALRASQLAQTGDLKAAEGLLSTVVAERPENIAYLYEQGVLLIELERYDEALALGRQIIDLNPRDARGFALEASSMVWQGQASAAIPIALSGLELDDRFAALYAALTRAYVDTSRWGEGLDTGERGLSLHPNDARLNRAYAYALQSTGAYEEAMTYLARSIELRPTYLPTQFELAGLYLARGRDQQAIDLYDRILSAAPRHARALLRQCLAYRKVGQFARALGFCEDAVDSDGSSPEALFHLGQLYYRERRFEQSRDVFQQCVQHDAGAYGLSCLYRQALSHYYTGDCDAGWELLQESLLIAQAREGVESAVDNIQQGLAAIAADPQCSDYAAPADSFQN